MWRGIEAPKHQSDLTRVTLPPFEDCRVIPVLWLSFVCEWGGGVGEVGHL